MAFDDIKIRVSTTTKAALGKFKRLKSSMLSLKGLAIAGLGMFSLKKAFDATTEAAGVQEDAIAGLTQQLVNNGEATKKNIDLLTKEAAARQKVTKFGDEQTIAAQTSLLTYGLTAQTVKDLTATMQDFTAGSPQINDMTMAAKLLGLAFKGDTAMLKRYGLVIDSTLPKQEKFKAVIETINKQFGGAAAAQAKTYTGIIQQMKNAFGDTLESLGMFITRSRKVREVIETVKVAFTNLTNWLDKKREAEEANLGVMAKYIGLTKEQIVQLDKLGSSHVLMQYARDLAALHSEEIDLLDTIAAKEKNRLTSIYSFTNLRKKLSNVLSEQGDIIQKIKKLRGDGKAIQKGLEAELEASKKVNQVKKESVTIAQEGNEVEGEGQALRQRVSAEKIQLFFTELEQLELSRQRDIASAEDNSRLKLDIERNYAEKVRLVNERIASEKSLIDQESLLWFQAILEEEADSSRTIKEKSLELAKEVARSEIEIKRNSLSIIESLKDQARQNDLARQQAILEDENINMQDKKDIIFDLQAEIERMNETIEGGNLSPAQIDAFLSKYREIANVSKSYDDAALQEGIADGLANLNKQVEEFDVKALRLEIDESESILQVKRVAGSMYDALSSEIKRLSESNPIVVPIKGKISNMNDLTNGEN